MAIKWSAAKLSVVALWVYCFLIAIWQCIDFSFYEFGWLVRLANYGAFWLGISAALGCVLALGLSQWWLGCSLGLLSVVVLVPYGAIFTPKSIQNEHPSRQFGVMTYSVMGRNENIEGILGVVRENPSDIVLFQELRGEYGDTSTELIVKRELSGLYGGSSVYFVNNVLSRYPLMEVEPVGRLNGVAVDRVVVDIPGTPVQVWNVHLVKPTVDISRHLAQVELLLKAASETSGPIVIGGDFNTPERGEGYRRLRRYFRDAYVDAGRGLGFTFPSGSRTAGILGPFVRIDYIFLSPTLCALEADVLDVTGGSDHFPLIARVGLCRSKTKL